MAQQAAIDQQNTDFWSELCGSYAARHIVGITDHSPASLKRFDDWYMDYYPYLARHVPYRNWAGLSVLEVGLGYGTLSQKLAESCSHYTGLDIAPGPVGIVNARLAQAGLNGEAIEGSILNAPFKNESFDRVVAIGCFHHTGDMQKSIDESLRLLKPGGQLVFMVYNAYSYRRWIRSFIETGKLWLQERSGFHGTRDGLETIRRAYDANDAGEAAPHTEFVSKKSLYELCKKFSNVSVECENIINEFPLTMFTREGLMKSPLPKICGLDLYVTCTK